MSAQRGRLRFGPKSQAAVVVGALLSAALFAPAREPTPAGASRSLLWLADGKPIRIDLDITVDGQPLEQANRAAWDDYVRRLFAHLDRNGDGVLDESEARGAPPPPAFAVGGGRSANVAFNFGVVDANGDGKVTLAELAEFYRQFGNGSFAVQPAGLSVGESPGSALFRKADKDGDGKLSAAEIAALSNLIDVLDKDGDETITGAELGVPPTPPGSRPANGDVVDFDPNAADSFNRVVRERLGDAAANAPPAVVSLAVRLGAKPVLEVRNAGPCTVTLTPDGVVLRVGTDRLDLRILRDDIVAAAAEHGSALWHRYLDLDAKGRGRVERKDAGLDRPFRTRFELYDRDGDGTVTESEMHDYLEAVHAAQMRALLARATLRVAPAGRGLFDLLDRNRDGRLSRRELRDAAKVLAPYAAPDGSVSADALPRAQQWAIGLSDLDSDEPTVGLPLWGAGAAPLWFRKMDRNRDGDISLREFLGRPELFKKLDADGDGLISLAEAEGAKK